MKYGNNINKLKKLVGAAKSEIFNIVTSRSIISIAPDSLLF